MNVAIVLAGGSGVRVGSPLPKQFIKVLGKPIMVYTLETFQADRLIDEIVLVCIASHLDLAKQYCTEYKLDKVRTIIPGGADFFHSCMNGMNSLRDRCTDDNIVVVTAAGRPFITQEEIDDSIKVCQTCGCGVAARKCEHGMFRVDHDKTHSHDYMRETLIQIAAPWAFKYGRLLEVLESYENGRLPACESYPLAAYAAAGHEIYFSKAFAGNIKITQKHDILLMEQMLLEKQNGEE